MFSARKSSYLAQKRSLPAAACASFRGDTCETVRVQDISIVSGKPAAVSRPEGSQVVYLTFEGLRESRTIADKLTRLRVALPLAEARRLRQLLDDIATA